MRYKEVLSRLLFSDKLNGEVLKNIRIAEAGKDYLIGASGYRLFRFDRRNARWSYFSRVNDLKFAILSRFRLLARLFRAEVHFYKTLRNKEVICIAKGGIYKFSAASGKFEQCFRIPRGNRPLNICEDSHGFLYFGEYFHNAERTSVNIYMSEDSGETWKVVYTFPAGSIRHIHGLHFDEFENSVWVTTGDLEGECMIGYSSDQFSTFNIVFRGGQEYRTCNLLFYGDKILYGTDSETARNYIKQIDRSSLKVSTLAGIQGSVIKSVKIGSRCFFSTTIEPSEINKDQHAYIWMYDDSIKRSIVIAKFAKDCWDHRYFQFGLCRFPEYLVGDDTHLFFTGVALKKIDGHSISLEISKIKELTDSVEYEKT
ncbi:hypothetical protein TBC1_12801 [Lentimicrobium saccharophilum]|uniref:Exo-alpha-sialidase n=1 Tax=Lentimicrobium saccharophilum TaxID=1678841 RepID=A0A0S7C6V7_9BACT|nr:hypothetical protein TBC1_12801 [Lentimicrobium saccharophilum]